MPGAWEGGKEGMASCLQTWFKWYMSDSTSLAEAGDPLSSVYVTVLPKPFQNSKLWWVFFFSHFYHVFNSLCMWRRVSQLTLSPFAWNRVLRRYCQTALKSRSLGEPRSIQVQPWLAMGDEAGYVKNQKISSRTEEWLMCLPRDYWLFSTLRTLVCFPRGL